VAIVVNVVFFLLVNVWPTWRVVPFLTEATQEVLVLVNLSLLAGVVVNTLNLALDLAWVRAVGEIVPARPAYALSPLSRNGTVTMFEATPIC